MSNETLFFQSLTKMGFSCQNQEFQKLENQLMFVVLTGEISPENMCV